METLVAGTPAKVIVAPGANPSPLMLMKFPPAVVPELGLMDWIVGGRYENAFGSVAVWPSGFVTTTSTTAGRCKPVRTVMFVAVIVRIAAGAPPNVTLTPPANPEPWMVTLVPPRYMPELGLINEIVGGGAKTNVYAFVRQLWVPSGFVTHRSADPAACEPVVAVIVVDVATLTLLAGTPPTDTVAPSRNPVPFIVTTAPRLEPERGAIVANDNDTDGV
jgi:hypothetical protein